jgi:limonene-1,2-epoxide hydrolase
MPAPAGADDGQLPSLIAVSRLIAAWEALDVDAIMECFTQDAVWHNMPYAPIVGHGAIRAAVAKFLNDMTGCVWEVRLSAASGPNVVMNERIDRFATRSGGVIIIPVTGVFEIRGGRVRVWRDYFDAGAVQVQKHQAMLSTM